jgi:SAM-dependent methyltransferase
MLFQRSVTLVTRRFLTDDEYRDYFFAMGQVRSAIARDLAEMAGGAVQMVIDIASGHGLYAMEVARALPQASVHATGLEADKRTFLETASLLSGSGLNRLPHLTADLIRRLPYVVCDVTTLPFRDGLFDVAANFLGLEDIRMTRKDEGVRMAIREASRVTKPGGIAEFAVQVFGDSPVDILSKEINESIGHGAVFLGPAIYEAMMDDSGLKIISRKRYSTEAVLTATQATEELRYACQETGKVYRGYGIKTKTFEDIWAEFGDRIETLGYALYTDILAMFSVKR